MCVYVNENLLQNTFRVVPRDDDSAKRHEACVRQNVLLNFRNVCSPYFVRNTADVIVNYYSYVMLIEFIDNKFFQKKAKS